MTQQPATLKVAAVSKRQSRAVVIMGAGPAGLTAAYELARHHVPALVLEKDPRFVGGISRTEERGGYRFDIGGHRFFSKSQEVEDFWTEVASDLLVTRGRLSRIYYRGKYFDYPLKAANALLNMGPVETVRCLSSYLWAKLRPVRNPVTFEDWVRNEFGYRLFSIFFKTYTEKVWGISTRELSADWAAQRIKGLDLAQAIRSALPSFTPKQAGDRGAVIKTLIDEFRYPRLGPGQLWERVRDRIVASGQQVRMGQQVVAIHHRGGQVTHVITRDAQTGEEQQYEGTDFISTLPVRELVQRCVPPLPPPVQYAASQLKYRDFLTVAVIINRAEMFPDNWIYIHDPSVKVGRMQNFKNWSPDMAPDQSRTCLGLEYFCFEGDGLWDSTDEQLVALAQRELAQLGMCRPEEVIGGVVVRQPKAYPVYDDVYKQHLAVIRDYLRARLPNLHLVGRNGMHHYNNQDHSMMTALLAARNIATGTNFDPWKVNTDAEYHEELHPDEEDASGRLTPARLSSRATPQPALAQRARTVAARLVPDKKHWPFLLILLLALNLLTININLPWGSRNEDNGLVFETIAVNHVRYGLGITKGQDLRDADAPSGGYHIPGQPPGAAEFHYLLTGPVHTYFYGDHPPLLGLTIAAGFKLLGVHYWVERLVPILYSLAGLIVFYLLMIYLFDISVARFASLLYAGFPMLAYFGRDVAHEAPTLFWALILLTAYFHWLNDQRRSWLALMAGSMIIGGFYGWPMFYIGFILFAVHWLATRRFDLKLALAVVLPTVVTFALALAQIAWVLGGMSKLAAVFGERTGTGADPANVQFTFFGWFVHLRRFNAEAFGLWAEIATPFAALFAFLRARVEGWSPRIRLIVISFLFGLAHILVFRQGAYIHVYWQFYFLPFFAMTIGWAGVELVRRFVQAPWQRAGALTAMGLVALALNWQWIHTFYTSGPGHFVPLITTLLH